MFIVSASGEENAGRSLFLDIICQLLKYRQALQAAYSEMGSEADEQAGGDADGRKDREIEPQAGSLQDQHGGQQLSEVVEEAAGGAHAQQAEPARFLQQAHGSEGDEGAAHAVEEDGRPAAEHGGEQYTHGEDQQDVAPGGQGVEGNDSNEIGEAELGTRDDEGQRNEPLEDEKRKGLGDEQAYENEAEGPCCMHVYTSQCCAGGHGLMSRNDIGSGSVTAAFDLDDKLVRQADERITGA